MRDEAASDDGLTWPELKTKLSEIAVEHNYTPKPEDWEMMKKIFDHVDTNGNGSVSPSELESAISGHDH